VTEEKIDTAAIKARAEKAHRHIADICAQKARWKMTIPANPETDSDLIFSSALNDIDVLLAELATMTAVAESNKRAHAYAVQEIQRLNAKLVAGHDGCEAELQQMALRDDGREHAQLRGQVVTLLGVCDGLKRFDDYDPATAHVTVHEIERIFDDFDSADVDGNAPVESPDDGDLVELRLEPVTADVLEIAAAAARCFPNPDVSIELVDDEHADCPDCCHRCGGLDGTHIVRDCAGNAPIESPAADEHPEERCNRCSGPYVSWSAPSPLWNQVMRGGDINRVPEPFRGIICPSCFAQLAEEQGIAGRWRFYAEQVHVELATVTPSGRVWNPQTWLWDDAPADVPAQPAARFRLGRHIVTNIYDGDESMAHACRAEDAQLIVNALNAQTTSEEE
jgi:hypothetical protein